MNKLTVEQAVVLSGFTGLLHGSLNKFHEDLEKRMGRPVFSHELGSKEFTAKVKELYRDDFIAMQPDNTEE